MPLIDSLLDLPNHLVLGAAFAFMALVLVGGIIRPRPMAPWEP
jgi:aspartyl protease family protein